MSKQSLLLVDGDTRSLRVLEVSLRKAGFTVTTAVSVNDALDKLQLDAPDLIISETTFPDGDGFELRRRVRAKPEWGEIPFIFLTAENAIENKIRGLELGVDDYLTKPIYIKEIITRINILLQKRQRTRFEERRDGRTRFAGRVADMPVVDVIQTVEISRKAGVIQFVGDRGRQAAIYFRDGRVIDAEAGALQGEDAVYRLLTWNDGEFEVVFRTVRRREVINVSAQGLLMEGMRRLDEWSRLLEQLPPLQHRFDIDVGELAARLGDVPDEQNRILRMIDGKRTLLEVIDASDVGDLECLQVISKLYFEELLVDLDHGAPARRDTGKPMAAVDGEAAGAAGAAGAADGTSAPLRSPAEVAAALSAASAAMEAQAEQEMAAAAEAVKAKTVAAAKAKARAEAAEARARAEAEAQARAEADAEAAFSEEAFAAMAAGPAAEPAAEPAEPEAAAGGASAEPAAEASAELAAEASAEPAAEASAEPAAEASAEAAAETSAEPAAEASAEPAAEASAEPASDAAEVAAEAGSAEEVPEALPAEEEFPGDEGSLPGALMGGYRPSSLRLIDEAVAAAQAIEPLLFEDLDDAPHVNGADGAAAAAGEDAGAGRPSSTTAPPPLGAATSKAAPGSAAGTAGDAGSWRPVAMPSLSSIQPGGAAALVAAIAKRPVSSMPRATTDPALRMIGSAGHDRAEASGELKPGELAPPPAVGETQREIMTIKPRRAARETQPPASEGTGTAGATPTAQVGAGRRSPTAPPPLSPSGGAGAGAASTRGAAGAGASKAGSAASGSAAAASGGASAARKGAGGSSRAGAAGAASTGAGAAAAKSGAGASSTAGAATDAKGSTERPPALDPAADAASATGPVETPSASSSTRLARPGSGVTRTSRGPGVGVIVAIVLAALLAGTAVFLRMRRNEPSTPPSTGSGSSVAAVVPADAGTVAADARPAPAPVDAVQAALPENGSGAGSGSGSGSSAGAGSGSSSGPGSGSSAGPDSGSGSGRAGSGANDGRGSGAGDDKGAQARGLVRQAEDALAEGAYDRALRTADSSLALRKSTRAFIARAKALQRLDRVPEALAALTQAEQLSPRSAAIYELRGRILWAVRRREEARQQFELFLEVEPEGARAAQIKKLLAEPR